MCLLAFAYKKHPVYSLILIANRDEYLHRPSASMHAWPDTQVLAGKDLVEGGTWFGVNPNGKFAIVTNYREGTKVQTAEGSRGALTKEFLTTSSTAHEYLHTLAPKATKYRDFNLLVGDNSGLSYLSNRTDEIHPAELSSGIYGLSNHLLDTPWRKVTQIKSALSDSLTREQITPEALWPILSDTRLNTDQEPLPSTGVAHSKEQQLSAVFVQMPGYGTRTSTLVLQKHSGETDIYERTYRLPTNAGTGTTQPSEYDEKHFLLHMPTFGALV